MLFGGTFPAAFGNPPILARTFCKWLSLRDVAGRVYASIVCDTTRRDAALSELGRLLGRSERAQIGACCVELLRFLALWHRYLPECSLATVGTNCHHFGARRGLSSSDKYWIRLRSRWWLWRIQFEFPPRTLRVRDLRDLALAFGSRWIGLRSGASLRSRPVVDSHRSGASLRSGNFSYGRSPDDLRRRARPTLPGAR